VAKRNNRKRNPAKNPLAKNSISGTLKKMSRNERIVVGAIAAVAVVLFIRSRWPGKKSGETGVGRTEVFPINEESLGHVQSLAQDYLEDESDHPAVRDLALRILERANLGTNSQAMDVARALHRYVCDEIRFQDDPQGFERMVSPAELANQVMTYGPSEIAVDCDDTAVLLAALCRSVGIQATVAFLDTDKDGAIDHAITVILIDGKPIYTETTIKGAAFGWVPPSSRVETLLAPDMKPTESYQYGVNESGNPAPEVSSLPSEYPAEYPGYDDDPMQL
jgi:hypothetical protein